jgi:hypothetical protein
VDRVSIGGRSYSDPDVLSLIQGHGGQVDPRAEIIGRARELNARLRTWGGVSDPRERLAILASFAGIIVKPMVNIGGMPLQRREALIYRDHDGQRFAYYDPTFPDGRVNFSIAHEIVHTFFPNSRNGARFRNLHSEDSREANELERLCDLGASELLMPLEEFLDSTQGEMGLHLIPGLSTKFGSSFEATVFRLATACDGRAVAGLLQYRLRKDEERSLARRDQQFLFEADPRRLKEEPVPRYRRQAFHSSAKCGPEFTIPWNKSFDTDSCVYRIPSEGDFASGVEVLPAKSPRHGILEACPAPYQRATASRERPDLLFLWWATSP